VTSKLVVALAFLPVACAAERGTIGALLGQQPDGRVVVREAPKGLAADRAGVREGDEILTVEGRDVRQMSAAELHKALSGEVGEAVKLTLLRGKEVLRVTVRRTPARRSGGSAAASK
jgi:C-terminal processing protease CtpA/Prc